jgi:hypothetical protein
VGRHARRSRWEPSDRGLAIMQVWGGFGTLVLTAALLVIALIGPSVSSTSGPSVVRVPLAGAMQRLAITAANATVATWQLNKQLEQP